jgi:hypothetical protein
LGESSDCVDIGPPVFWLSEPCIVFERYSTPRGLCWGVRCLAGCCCVMQTTTTIIAQRIPPDSTAPLHTHLRRSIPRRPLIINGTHSPHWYAQYATPTFCNTWTDSVQLTGQCYRAKRSTRPVNLPGMEDAWRLCHLIPLALAVPRPVALAVWPGLSIKHASCLRPKKTRNL